MVGSSCLYIVMLPWLAMGHLLPFFELSKRIAQHGHRISFFSTLTKFKRLPKLPPHLSPLINLVELSLPSIEHLPEAAEATIDLPSDDLRPYLRQAFDTFEDQLERFLQNAPPALLPDWIIFDYAAYWTPRVAAKFGVPCAFLGLHNAAAHSFFGPPSALLGGEGAKTKPEDLLVVPPWVPFPSAIVFRRYEAEEVFKPGLVPDDSGVSEAHRYGTTISGCNIVVIRSCTEFEPDWLRLLGRLYDKPVIPAGLFPASNPEDETTNAAKWAASFAWLDKQPLASVVYVAFGSEVKPSRSLVHEVALGLESSELPFVLAVRSPEEWLPEGFVDRNKERGVVCLSWVPQNLFLKHPSVGGFMTHCGWNSIVEGLGLGLALVLLPLMFDQGLNARNLSARGIGVEVPRNEEDGSVKGDDIAKSLRLAMVEEQGGPFRDKAKQWRDVFGNEELHDRYIKDLIRYLKDYKQQ